MGLSQLDRLWQEKPKSRRAERLGRLRFPTTLWQEKPKSRRAERLGRLRFPTTLSPDVFHSI